MCAVNKEWWLIDDDKAPALSKPPTRKLEAGNGTQKMFLESDKVLFVSVHRYDNGSFYPGKTPRHSCASTF